MGSGLPAEEATSRLANASERLAQPRADAAHGLTKTHAQPSDRLANASEGAPQHIALLRHSRLCRSSLLELPDRLIDRGVVLTGDITISVADVDLIEVGLNVLLASTEQMERLRAGTEPRLAPPEGGPDG